MLPFKQLYDNLSQGQHQKLEQWLKHNLLTRTSRAWVLGINISSSKSYPTLTLNSRCCSAAVSFTAYSQTPYHSQVTLSEVPICTKFLSYLLFPLPASSIPFSRHLMQVTHMFTNISVHSAVNIIALCCQDSYPHSTGDYWLARTACDI